MKELSVQIQGQLGLNSRVVVLEKQIKLYLANLSAKYKQRIKNKNFHYFFFHFFFLNKQILNQINVSYLLTLTPLMASKGPSRSRHGYGYAL